MSRLAFPLVLLPLLPACADDAAGTGTNGETTAADASTGSTDPTTPSGMTSGSATASSTSETSVDSTGVVGSSGNFTTGSDSSGNESSGETTDGPQACMPLRGEGAATAAARLGEATPQITGAFDQVIAVAPVDGAAILAARIGRYETAVDPLATIPASTGISDARGVLAGLDDTGDYQWTHLLETEQIGASTPFVNLTAIDGDEDRAAFIGVFRGDLALDGVDVPGCNGRCALFGWVDADGSLDGPIVIPNGAVVDAPIITSVALRPDGGMVMGGAASGSVSFGGAVLNNTPIEEDVNIGVFDEKGEHVWSRRWGGEGEEQLGGLADLDGDVLAVATTSDQLDFGGGPLGDGGTPAPDVVVARLDGEDGEHVWSVVFEATGGFAATTRVSSQDGLVIVGVSGGEMSLDIEGRDVSGGSFVVGLDADTGQVQWHRAFDGAARIWGLDTRCDEIAIAGSYSSTFTYDGVPAPLPAGIDAFAARLSLQDGSLRWLQVVTDATQGEETQQPNDVAFGPDDALWLAGYFVGDINPGTGLLQSGLGGPGADGFTIRLDP